MNFDVLGLKQTLVETVSKAGYTAPTPIQESAIPVILTGKDILAAAQTGTGKTAGYILPILQALSEQKIQQGPKQVRALILTPTRELAAQVYESICRYGKQEKLKSTVIFGGVNISPQRRVLAQGVDILVATPGRLLDLHQQKALKLDAVEIFVLDEADRMLDMGFIHAIRKIESMLPKRRQNLMFSATFSDSIRTLAKTICHQPVEIDVSPRNSVVKAISQQVHHVPKDQKAVFLFSYLRNFNEQALVFSRTKHGADKLAKLLNKADIHTVALHGNKSQNQRTKALDDFKNNKAQVMVATDIAARGIDIQQLELVVNFDLPHVPEDYLHRIGRTGRAGASGLAISIVSPDEKKQLNAIEKLLKGAIPRSASQAEIVDGLSDIRLSVQADTAIPKERIKHSHKPKKFAKNRNRRNRVRQSSEMDRIQSSDKQQQTDKVHTLHPKTEKRTAFGSSVRSLFQFS